MMYGLYAAAAGLDVQQARLDADTNNLANADTPGFQEDRVTVTSFPDVLNMLREDGPASGQLGTATFGPLVQGSATDFSEGPVNKTEKPTDLAVSGNTYFTVQGPGGQNLYTRDGQFTVDGAGYLTTATGERVLGTHGPIRVGGGSFTVDAAGRVKSGNITSTLRLTMFTNPQALVKSGDNFYTAPPAAGMRSATTVQVEQGYLSGSNTNQVTDMVDMETVLKEYESAQKMIQAEDSIMGQSAQLGSTS
ncbi:MAG TPA: flagellar hook-basal body protein [Spirochaetia bacterium]|nr:flagellar hook-basal body protein [Spirochaetia bacterium]